MIAVALSLLVLVPSSTEPAMCVIRPPWRLEGESWDQAFARQDLDRQAEAYERADAIYLVETVDPEPESWSSKAVVVSVLRGAPRTDFLSVNSPRCARTYPGGISLVVLYEEGADGVLQPIGTYAPEALRDARLIAIYDASIGGRDNE